MENKKGKVNIRVIRVHIPTYLALRKIRDERVQADPNTLNSFSDIILSLIKAQENTNDSRDSAFISTTPKDECEAEPQLIKKRGEENGNEGNN